jgi:two-component system chemotaxis response regulator CheB
MLAEHNVSLEAALWAALRALEESTTLSRRLAERAHKQGHITVEQRFDSKAEETDRQANIIRSLLFGKPEALDQPDLSAIN